jgi:serine/threonine protein kinase
MNLIGTTLNNYTFEKEIGDGGMANVYLAKHSTLGHKVAIKVLKHEFVQHPNIRKRFLAEARNLAKMDHPHVVKVTDLIDAGDIVAFAMEYIEGQTLQEYIDQQGPLKDETISALWKQMIAAIDYIHDQGFVHRDVKPSNFMLGKDGKIKLLDFGIAKNNNTDTLDYTKTGLSQQMGTPLYMSPEQIKSTSDVTKATDIYSLGIVLWQMVKGKNVYNPQELSLAEIQAAIIRDPLPLTNTKWDSIIISATQKDPLKRSLEPQDDVIRKLAPASKITSRRIGLAFGLILTIVLLFIFIRGKEVESSQTQSASAQTNVMKDTMRRLNSEPKRDTILQTRNEIEKKDSIKNAASDKISKEKDPNKPIIKPSKNEKSGPEKKLELGDSYEGGIVFYLNEDKTHGLICSQYDLGKFDWFDAKQLCSEASYGGNEDWRLPNDTELLLLFFSSFVIDGFKEMPYWSSSRSNTGNPIHIHFQDGSKSTFFEAETELYVRAIRSF